MVFNPVIDLQKMLTTWLEIYQHSCHCIAYIIIFETIEAIDVNHMVENLPTCLTYLFITFMSSMIQFILKKYFY